MLRGLQPSKMRHGEKHELIKKKEKKKCDADSQQRERESESSWKSKKEGA